MKRPLAIVVVAGVALSLGCGASAGADAPRPALRLVQPSPLVVRGIHFRSGETVEVTYRAAAKRFVRRVRAGAAGTFTVRFAEVTTLSYCSGGGLAVVARGDGGSLATAKLPMPLCPPPLSRD